MRDARHIDEHDRQPRERGVDARRRDREAHREGPRQRKARQPTEHPRGRLVDIARLRARCRARSRLALRPAHPPAVAHELGHPRKDRRKREHGPHAQREAPARGIRHRHSHERRHERGDGQQRRVQRRHRADAIGEVLLDERRQHDVAHADRREQHRRADEERKSIGCQGAADHRRRRHDHRGHREPLEPETPLEGRRHDAEDREAHRRGRTDQTEDPRRHGDVGLDLGEDRRQRRHRRAEGESDQHDAGEREEPAAPQGERARVGHSIEPTPGLPCRGGGASRASCAERRGCARGRRVRVRGILRRAHPLPSAHRASPQQVDARVSPAAHGADAGVSSLASPRPRRGIPRSRCR